MPAARKTRKTAAQREAEAAKAAHAARPFADDSTDPYGSRSDDAQRAVAESVAADKAAGMSGNELRTKYGERLTGPQRRKLLRAHGLDSAATIARSYGQYRDGDPRSGTRHAREHGALAAQRRKEHAEAEAAKAEPKAMRAALREAGQPVPRAEAKLRAAYAAHLLAPASA